MEIAVCVGLDKGPIKASVLQAWSPMEAVFSGRAFVGGWIIWVLP